MLYHMTSYAMLYRTVRSVRVCMEFTFFFVHWPPFLFWPRVFSRGLGCGACRGPACTHGASLGPGRACSGHSKSRELASNHGIAFRRAIANQAHGNPDIYIFTCFHFFTSPLLFLKYYSSRQRLGSHGATAALNFSLL